MDRSEICWPGWPSTESVKFLALPRLCGAAEPVPTVAPATASATMTTRAIAAGTSTRGRRSAWTRPPQPGARVTAGQAGVPGSPGSAEPGGTPVPAGVAPGSPGVPERGGTPGPGVFAPGPDAAPGSAVTAPPRS